MNEARLNAILHDVQTGKLVHLEPMAFDNVIRSIFDSKGSFEARMATVELFLEPYAEKAQEIGIRAERLDEITLDLRRDAPFRKIATTTYNAVFPDGERAQSCYGNPLLALAAAYIFWTCKQAREAKERERGVIDHA